MKKTTAAIAAAVILISCLFAACNGADSGKVSDTQNNDPILTTLEDMMTEAATDIENMFTDNASGATDNITGNLSTSATTIA